MRKLFQNIGPSAIIAAAFIGPGTITVCSLAGIQFGYELLWALFLSIVATLILQEMSARLGLVTRLDLAATIRNFYSTKWKKMLSLSLVIIAIVIGNAAYEAGNITGAVLGLKSVFGFKDAYLLGLKFDLLPMCIGLMAMLILGLDSYAKIEKVLIALVVLMSASFVTSAILIKPDWLSICKGLFIPRFPTDSLTTILAIVGTTVVPYNLFLHSAIVQEKWTSAKQMGFARRDIVITIGLGGLVSMCVVIVGAALHANKSTATSFSDFALGLAPLYGDYATYLLGFGFFAAGITSTITAALAAAYVLKSCLQWKGRQAKVYFKWVWFGIILAGIVFSSFGIQPLHLIQTAQISNALVLPFTAVFLYVIVNNTQYMGNYANNWTQKIIGILILGFTVFLGFKSLVFFFLK